MVAKSEVEPSTPTAVVEVDSMTGRGPAAPRSVSPSSRDTKATVYVPPNAMTSSPETASAVASVSAPGSSCGHGLSVRVPVGDA